eukprot:22727_1
MAEALDVARDRRRKRAIEELLKTEKTYVHLMSKLVEHFVLFLRNNKSTLAAEDYHILFPADIHAILGLNQTFLKELTTVIESKDFNNKNTKIGDIIYDFCPHFKMYQMYLNNYQYAVTRLAQLRQKKTSPFSMYCNMQRQQAYFNNLPLESLIILPIQRMPRYKMLLEEITKHTCANHPDLKQLQNALSKISEVNTMINNRMKEFDQRIEVQNIENRFNGKITNLVTPARKYLKQGQLCKIETKDDEYYLFILFSDCLLYASPSRIGDTLTFGNLLYFNSKFVIKETSESTNLNHIQNLFEIHSTSESFMVYAETKTIMNDWISSITEAYNQYMSLASSMHDDEFELKIYPKILFIPNDFSDKCMLKGCHGKFSVVNRRHHCRYCGLLICNKCSSQQLRQRPTRLDYATAPGMVRVCDHCYDVYKPPPAPKLAKRQSKMMSFAKAQTDQLMQLFDKRAQTVEKRAAMLTFVKQDVEPKLIRIESEKIDLQQTVMELQTANRTLQERVRFLENELKQKDQMIKELQEGTPPPPNIYQSVQAPPPTRRLGIGTNIMSITQTVTPIKDTDEAFISDDEDEDKTPPKICSKCKVEIVGRALKTKDGLYHKLCLVCDECSDPLPGKPYTIVFRSGGVHIKLCQKCRNDEDNENVQNQFKVATNRRDTYCVTLDD